MGFASYHKLMSKDPASSAHEENRAIRSADSVRPAENDQKRMGDRRTITSSVYGQHAELAVLETELTCLRRHLLSYHRCADQFPPPRPLGDRRALPSG